MTHRTIARPGILGFLVCLGIGLVLSAHAQNNCPGDSSGNRDFRCASRVAPGKLTHAETPQFILVTFDDGINSFAESFIQPIVKDLRNPDGRKSPVTYFLTKVNTEPALARQRYLEGNELANHTATHLTGPETTPEEWRQELSDLNQFLVNDVGLPSDAIAGFRAPNLATSENMWEALKDLHFLYDASLSEIVTVPPLVSTGPDSFAWPHTLDFGSGLACLSAHCPDIPLPGIWSIPLWVLYDRNGNNYGALDPAVASDSIFHDILEYNFQQRYDGNRCPLGLYSHAGQLALPGRQNVLRAFLQEKLALPDVWMITMRGLIEWMREPVPVSGLPDWFAQNRDRGVGRPAVSPPPATRLISPDSGALLSGATVRLSWDVLLSASTYHIQVSPTPDFSVSLVDTMDLLPAALTVDARLGPGTLFWRVRGMNAGGAGPWSQTRSFSTGSLAIVGETAAAPEEFHLEQNYPNPFNPSTTIAFTLPRPAYVTLKVLNPLGGEVASLVNGPMAAGRHSVVWNAEKQASGVYFFRMSAGDFLSTRKLVLLH
ncbi:MAG: hypothetical protein H6Q31_1467 [Bacteroidetes bacterium]|nr:hypothetical protein [Bacteroidota bacterium]